MHRNVATHFTPAMYAESSLSSTMIDETKAITRKFPVGEKMSEMGMLQQLSNRNGIRRDGKALVEFR